MKKKYWILLLLLVSAAYSFGQCSITCPEDITTTCPYDVPFISPSAYTDCGTVILQTWTLTGATTGSSPATGINDASLEVFQYGVTTVTYYVEDDNGNSATCSFTVTITDAQPPLLICPNDILVANDLGKCSAKVNDFGFMSAWDNCSGITLELISGLPRKSDFPVGTTTNVFKFTDAAGNSSTCSFDIVVTDEEDPVITCPATIVVNATLGSCSANVSVPIPVATDNCSISSISNSFNSGGADASDIYPVGTTTVTYIAADASGRTATCSIDVIVVNNQTPVITLNGLSSMILEACNTYIEPGATALDTCLGDVSGSITIDDDGLDTSVTGTYTITYMVNGDLASQVSRTVTVVDTTAPTLTLKGPNPLTIGDCSTYTELGATATDCTGNLSSSIDISGSVDTNTLGTYYVTYNVSDATGNSATPITRTVNVIDVNLPVITLTGSNPQIIEACTPYTELGAIALDPCSGDDISGSLVIDASNVDTSTVGFYNVTYNVTDAYGNVADEYVRVVEVVDTTIIANAGSDITNSDCTDTTVTLSGNPVSGNSTGLWAVTSGQTSGYSFSDPTSSTATFTGDVGEVYELTWTINNPCGISSDTVTITFVGCNAIDFDGVNDNITFKDNYNFSGEFSVEVWVKPETNSGAIQTIISKREVNNQTDGYDLRLVNSFISFTWNNGNMLTSPYAIPLNIWSHIAVTYGSGTYRLYIDGVEVASGSGSIPVSNSNDCILGAMDQNMTAPYKPVNYFNGAMDELRIWDVALTTSQIHYMMNQEIEENSGNITGKVIPENISGLSWNHLAGYYQMNQSNDLTNGKLTSNGPSSIDGKLRYMTTFQEETAPLPYLSKEDGLWTNEGTWQNGNSQNIPNSTGVDGSTVIDWNIVKTSHNITSGNNNITLLGLYVNSNTLSVENTNPLDGQSIRITNYLKIDGTIDLVGESQLLQDTGSVVDAAGTGKIERDQQGTTNLYNYNYWGSPVSVNGSVYTIDAVLRDGTDSDNPKSLLWTSSYNAIGSTTPITLSNRWLYSYENYPINSYASWRYLGAYGSLNIGLGFTMKGSGASTAEQNYVFVGKPNNGNITIPITAGNEALLGNPYPSAIDANEFINDNSGTTQGALYFWEHYTTNATHVLRDYQGGYATYNLLGGIAAVSPPGISGNGTASKIPERYVPVAQGFFVESNGVNGNVVFENDQRIFVKESVTGAANNGSVFIKSNNTKNKTISTTAEEELIKRIRIDFKSPEGAIRHLLLGFVSDGLATDSYDYGYDAIVTDNYPSDLLWIIENERYVIQGVGDFDDTKKYPLELVLATSGTIDISLQELENFDVAPNVYIYDDLLGSYTKLDSENTYSFSFDSGTYKNRFYLAFKEDTSALSVDNQVLQNIVATYLNDSNELYIKVPASIQVKQVHLINLLGQTITSWNRKNTPLISQEFKIPIKNISEGAYIIKLEVSTGIVNKKVVVKF